MSRYEIEQFFKGLAKHYGIDIKHGWKTALFKKTGKKIGIAKPNTINNWISRERIPVDVIDKIQELDIADDLKRLCKASQKYHFSLEQHKTVGLSLEDSSDYFKQLYLLLSQHYPFKMFEKHIRLLISETYELRTALENQAFKDLPDVKASELKFLYFSNLDNKQGFDDLEILSEKIKGSLKQNSPQSSSRHKIKKEA